MIDKLGLDGLGGASVRVEPDRGLLGRIDDLQAELAASQAREQQLREALKALQQGFPQTHQINAVIRHALVTPQDDTALRQWGAKLLRDLADKGWPAWDADDLRLKADELEAGK